MQEKEKFLYEYLNFVDSVTADFSKNDEKFTNSIERIKNKTNVPRLLTSVMGLCGESGELIDLIKKVVFHGKELTDENILLIKKELGDIMWYWANACISLNFDPYDVLEENVRKLKARYPNGFEVQRSENRKN